LQRSRKAAAEASAWEDDRMCSSTDTMPAMDDWMFVDGISHGSAACSLTATTLGMGAWTDAGQDSAPIGMGIFVPRSVRVRNRFRNSDRNAIRQGRLNRLDMLRQERISEQRYFRNRGLSRRP
jgi:hypothetical protein